MAIKFVPFTDEHPEADPLGPGAPAWEEFDNAVDYYIAGDRMRGAAARARMRRHVKKHGGDVDAWVAAIKDRIITGPDL